MTPVLLDTHALIWFVMGNKTLGVRSRRLAERALAQANLYFSAVSFWEIAQLVFDEQLSLSSEIRVWREQVLDSGIRELALTGEAGIRGAEAMPAHGDPCDRMIVGAVLSLRATLITADAWVLAWKGRLQRQDASL